MSASGQDEPRQQTFHGPGSFGGDNKGIINNNVLLDPRTAAVMEDLNKKAPELATLLRKALRDGFISPEAVIALNRAVEHLNEDTAQAFRFAAERINEDTAISFQGVARDFGVADQQLSARVIELNNASESLREMIGQFNSAQIIRTQKVDAPDYQSQPRSAAGMPTRPSARGATKWWFTSQLMCLVLGVGLLATAILTHYHLGGDAQRIGGFAVAIPLIIWVSKLLPQVPTRKYRAPNTRRPPRYPPRL